ncbi:MAG TPA: malto-oligosyltrehalose trehalohydrolase [Verrucomicrobiae bacterium]|nr:malto-oligosyltrehalose trehalohydrolase [Verrucomicrobiae bacterium]
MHVFRVWAPLPKKVELQLNEKKLPMAVDKNGWWSVEVEAANPEDDYGFIVDCTGPYPDPRSPSQPGGIHKLSRLVDQAAFQWTDKNFQPQPLASALIYELHVGTFTPKGTFLSTIDKLDHLVTLGVTHVELMPVVEFSGDRGWGYDGVDLFAPHHAYGKPDDLKKLVDECHARGLSVILDVVYNHLGPAGNHLGDYGPYFTKKFATFWGQGINFDGPQSGEVRRFFCDNALMWMRDFHFDGLRLDAVHGIVDTSAIHILEQLKSEVDQLSKEIGRPLVLIAESDLNDPRLLWPRERGGYQLDAQWSDDFHHALHTVLTGERSGYYSDFGRISDLAKSLSHVFVYDGVYSNHRERTHGRPVDDLSGGRFLGYLQNHDQIGNRALGERSGQLLCPGKLKIGAALVMTSPFVPMLFQGEEWGARTPFYFFTGYQETELANAVRESRCREFAAFGWKPEDTADPQSLQTFERSKLDWSEISKTQHQEIFDWYRQLIRLRREEPALIEADLGRIKCHYSEQEQWLVMERDTISVVCNFSGQRQSISLRKGKHRTLLASDTAIEVTEDSALLPAESVVLLKLNAS